MTKAGFWYCIISFCLGGYNLSTSFINDGLQNSILQYDASNHEWSQVGTMKTSKRIAAADLISYSDIQNSCQLFSEGFCSIFSCKETIDLVKIRQSSTI